MSDKFQNKYRIASTRLQNWDYGWNGYYFVTTVTQNREYFFGEIENGKMILSHIGVIADILWYEIKNHTQNIKLDEFIVMPNHIHAIIIINNFNGKNDKRIDVNRLIDSGIDNRRDNACVVSTVNDSNDVNDSKYVNGINNDNQKTIGQKRFQNQGKNTLSSIIGSYKSAVSKNAHRLGYNFNWQPRFHDHLIRNENEYFRIKNYIQNNPQNWIDDKFNMNYG